MLERAIYTMWGPPSVAVRAPAMGWGGCPDALLSKSDTVLRINSLIDGGVNDPRTDPPNPGHPATGGPLLVEVPLASVGYACDDHGLRSSRHGVLI